MTTEAYCVLAGGGVKALCFAGALEAANSAGIDFLGYAGSSGGAIVATLACVGYTPREIRSLFQEFQLEALLGDVSSIRTSTLALDHGRSALAASGLTRKRKLWDAYRISKPIFAKLNSDFGLYDPQILKIKLLDLLNRALDTDHADITFDTLIASGLPDLRIVASDLSKHRPVVFGDGSDGYGGSVIEAVAASACFPVVFSPSEIHGVRRLVDGGVASNLPVFVFADRSHPVRSPTLAFDLVTGEEDGEAGGLAEADAYGLAAMASDLVSTALSASDLILQSTSGQANVVAIKVPPGLKTFSLSVDDDLLETAWNAGYTGASSFLSAWGPLRLPAVAGDAQRQQIQARYATQSLVMPLLGAIQQSVQRVTDAEAVRVSVMLPIDTKERMVAFDYGFNNAPDADLRLLTATGLTGSAFVTGKPIAADLENARNDPEGWGMTQAQINKVPLDRKSMIAVPIKAWTLGAAGRTLEEAAKASTIGTFSIDSSTPLDETGWVDDNRVKSKLSQHLIEWAEILAKLFD